MDQKPADVEISFLAKEPTRESAAGLCPCPAGLQVETSRLGVIRQILRMPTQADVGLLYLQGGRWDNKQIVSNDYVADSTAKHNNGGFPTGRAYGYLWWVTQTKTGLDAFFAAGIGGQLIYVVPKLGVVVAVASSSDIRGGGVRFVNDVVLPAASDTSAPPTCVAQLVRGQPLH